MNGNTIFELVSRPSSTYVDSRGRPRGGERPYSIQARATILDQREGKEGEITEIRYMRNQKSPYVDEQTVPEGVNSDRQMSKPQFTGGTLAVNNNIKNLVKFMKLHPSDAANQHWGLFKQKAIFSERDPVKIAAKVNNAAKVEVNAVQAVFETPYAKLLPVAKYLGFDTTKDTDLVKFDLKTYAESAPSEFLDYLNSPVVERFARITDAETAGVLRIELNQIVWADGRPIMQVPASHDAKNYFTDMTFETQHRATWAEVLRKLDKIGSPAKDEEAIASPAPTTEYSTADMLTIFKERGILDYKFPHFYHGDTEICRSKEDIYEYIEKNKVALLAELE